MALTQISPRTLKPLLPARPPDGHKGVFGHVLILAGSRGFTGAAKLAARVAGLTAVVAPAMAGDIRYFRVVAGPIAPGETGAAQSRLAAAGIDNSWAASLCTRSLGAPPCENP